MSAIVSIGGAISVCDRRVLTLFADCITGFDLLKIQYGYELRTVLPGGFRVVDHWGLDRIGCYQWIESNFPSAQITEGVHRLPESAIKGVMDASRI